MSRIYTRRGDDGTTGSLYGGRVAKDGSGPEAYGTVDEAVAVLGTARALAEGDTAAEILRLQRELFVVAAELATAPERRDRLEPGVTLVTAEMVRRLEEAIDSLAATGATPREFVVPGGEPVAAALDVARTVVRRAERRAVTHLRGAGIDGSHVVPYLNRLADHLFVFARVLEGSWTPRREEETR